MLIIEDADYEDAVQQLRSAGFRDWAWSYGSIDPKLYKGRLREGIYRRIVREYSNLDRNSTRFLFPPDRQNMASPPEQEYTELSPEHQYPTKVVLLPSSFTHIRIKSAPDGALTRDGNILYPDSSLLLRSFVQTLVREPVAGTWTSSLCMWAISYVYGELILDDDVLDSCGDEEAKAWFNERIRRFSGGIDGVTCTKRLGRVGYDEALARRGPA
ncbi:hypothetical protein HRG_003643 [Hirsutella rhossiliensis]|uniref:Uncharacterized protein n=1 Tax=Hirsutella rhossiliensis TaxID=111463 RepID=A0A9P8N2B1_9HYPO|nr:uncharacterized protein HRG_03643 [Hirsutella rhossiliensis]KAH0965627.1 hypothetical protein HRG_03643 [Hirsutella rhossiliensis]